MTLVFIVFKGLNLKMHMDELIRTFLNVKNSKNICISVNINTNTIKVTGTIIRNQIMYYYKTDSYPVLTPLMITEITYDDYEKYFINDLDNNKKLKEEFIITLEKSLIL